MADKTKKQLELEAALSAAEAALAAAKSDPAYAEKLAALKAAHEEARTARDAAHNKLLASREAWLIKCGVWGEPHHYSPALIAEIEGLIGVKYGDRGKVQPGNRAKDVFDEALDGVRDRVALRNPEMARLTADSYAASTRSNQAWMALSEHESGLRGHELAVLSARSALADYLANKAKRPDPKAPSAAEDAAAAKLAKEARAKLAAIKDGTIRLSVEQE